MDTAEGFEKLISKRDSLLKRNLNKELKLAKINLKKDSTENKKPKKNSATVNKPENPFNKQINNQNPVEVSNPPAKENKISEPAPEKKSLFKGFWKRTKEEVHEDNLKTQEENLPEPEIENPEILSEPKKIIKEKRKQETKNMLKPKGVAPTEEILKKEMEIDLKISREIDSKLKEENLHKKKRIGLLQKRQTSEEEVKKEIMKNSQKHVPHLLEEVKKISETLSSLRREVSKAVVGQEGVINAFICAILCDGHVLLEGVPGLAKTLIVKTLAEASGCSSNRIQFTVDLLPSDILGITTYTPQKGFETIKGPIFANFIVADEINRSPPKTQSAMIEAMQEKQVTIGKKTFKLPLPFFVMANNNPLEQSGVYDLPEAQVDRFLFKLLIGYPDEKEEIRIMEDNMTIKKFESFGVKPILSQEKILHMQKITKEIYVDERVKEYIVRIIDKTRKRDFDNGQYIEWGGSPRASIGLYIASKAWALIHGRSYVVPKDVKDIAHYVLRHRVILNYRAKAEKLTSDTIIDEILDMVEV